MSSLLITENFNNSKKTWKIQSKSTDEVFAFGTSRNAHFRSKNTDVKPIEVSVEMNSQGNWEVTYFDQMKSEVLKVEKDFEWQIQGSTLAFKVIPDVSYLQDFQPPPPVANSTDKIEMYFRQGKLVGSQLLKTGHSSNPNANPMISGPEVKVLTRDVQLPTNHAWAVEARKNTGALIAVACLCVLGLLGLIPPAAENSKTLANAQVQKIIHEQRVHLPQKPREALRAARGASAPAGSFSGLNNLSEKLAASLSKTSVQSRSPRTVASVGGVGRNWGNEAQGRAMGGSGISLAGLGTGSGSSAGHPAGNGIGTTGVEMLEEGKEIVGGLDREVIAQYIKSQIGQILYCYERQLSADPDLFGKVAVRFTIGSSGKVETQRIGQSTLRNSNVEACILQQVARWQFPTPEGGTKVNVTYPFLFKSTN